MRNNTNFRLLTLIDRRRRHQHHKQQWLVVGISSRYSWLVADDSKHCRCFTTTHSQLSYPPLAQNDIRPFRHPYSAIKAGASSYQSPVRQPRLFQSLLSHDFSSTASADEGKEGNHWNVRVEDFLKRTPESSTSVLSFAEDVSNTTENENEGQQLLPRPLRPDEVAETIQILLDDLLQITAAAAAMQKGDFQYAAENNVQSKGYDNDENNHYLDWRTTELSLSYSSSASSSLSEGNKSNSQTAHQNNITDEAVEVGLAFALMNRLVALEQANDSALINHTLQWTAHTSCLNPILQLWKQEYSPSATDGSKSQQQTSASVTLTPSEVLAKLDTYRQHSNLLIPDVQSYNIILDAVATHNHNTNRTMKGKGRNTTTAVDTSFCQSLWEWMWQEASQDSLVRPDEITLRIMLKANVFTGHELAPQRCESLVEEWANYHNTNRNDSNNTHKLEQEHQTINDPKGTLLQSLIHVWALHDPQVAESYLKELARRYLSGQSYNPPDTIAWNRVVSAYAIAHDQPSKGHQVLEDFWEFYQQAHGLVEATASSATSAPDNSANSGINTKSNSLQLSSATATSSNKEGSINVSLAKDNAIWKVHQPNLQTYNALLEGYARQNNAREANKIFERLQNVGSTSPNIATYTSAIKANGPDLERVKDLAQQCLTAYTAQEQQQEISIEEEGHKLSTRHINLDRAFFHAWLNACAEAENIKEAKKVLKQLKSFKLTTNATTYRMLMGVFLSRQDSQGAIEWLLAYAKLEGMSESAIVSCTTHLLDWYRHQGRSSEDDVDAMVLLQILCENDFITQEESLQQLLLGISANQGNAVLGWLGGKKDRTSLKMWAIVMRALAQEGSEAPDVEEIFLQFQDEQSWKEKFDQSNTSAFDDKEEKLVVEMYSSMIVAWSKQGNVNRRVKRRIKYWTEELEKYREGSLSLNLAAQVALVTMYCDARDPANAEQYVNGLELAYQKGRIVSPPDTIMCNMVLNAWAKQNNGLRAAAFFEERIQEPDAVSYNTVINAYARQGQLEKAEQWACKLIASFIENPDESRRPQQATFTVLLAAWRRSRHPNAAERAEKVLTQMQQLYDNNILLSKPNLKSYQTVLDTWEKSNDSDAAQKAENFLLSSSDFKTNKRLVEKMRYIKSRHRKRNRRFKKDNVSNSATGS